MPEYVKIADTINQLGRAEEGALMAYVTYSNYQYLDQSLVQPMAPVFAMRILGKKLVGQFIGYIMIIIHPYQMIEKYNIAVSLRLLDVPYRRWFIDSNRTALVNLLDKSITYSNSICLIVWHLDNLTFYGSMADFNQSRQILPFFYRMLEITSRVSCAFVTRISHESSTLNREATKDSSIILEQNRELARKLYDKLPLQQDMFESPSFESMPDWFKDGIWITPRYTT